MLLPDVEQHVLVERLGLLRVGELELGDLGRQPRVQPLGDVDVLVQPAHHRPQVLLLHVQGDVVLGQLVLAGAQRVQDAVEVLLGALVLAEVVGDLLADAELARRSPCCPSRLAGSRSSTVRRSSSRVLPTLEVSASPPASIARTGVCSSRLDVSAALRMSASPMLRTASACAEKVGEFSSAEFSAVRKSFDLGVQHGHLGGLDLRRHRRGLGRGDRRRAGRAR